jgi:hypothetical protein
MIATKEATIHEAVVKLLVRTGKGRIEAERLWDSVYSEQYHRATPGHKVTWVFGEYTMEFTKQADRNPLEVIAQANAEAQQAEASSHLRGKLQALALIVIVIAGYIYFF